MFKRRFFLLLIAGGILVGVAAVVFSPSREREPEYGGKRLSEWVKMLPSDEGAEKAVRAIGTNALPYLLRWIRYDMPSWKERLYETVNPALQSLNSEWGLYDEQTVRSSRAMFAFQVLGAEANSAIPEFIRMLHDPKGIECGAGAVALGSLGDEGLPPLLTVLTNQQHAPALRSSVVYMMAMIATNLETCDRVFNVLLTDTNLDVREAATNALAEIGRRVTAKRVRDERRRARTPATNALREIDPKALERGIQ